ncbi:MAG: YbjN domain-containing protein [Armatimonadetes bacterium]|nr:YbjN domain-containing protein [Armatimonadota bacterium]
MKVLQVSLACLLLAPLAFVQVPAVQDAPPTASVPAVTALSDADLRDILAGVKFGEKNVTIQEEKDSEGLTAFFVFEEKSVVLALYQYRDGADGPATSLGLSVGTRLPRGADVRKVNDWNATKRFVKAYVDEEGDAMLSSDLLVKPGTTRQAVAEWVRVFAQFSKEFDTFIRS